MVFQTKIKLAYTEISRFGKIRNKLLSQPLHTLHLQEFAKRGQKTPSSSNIFPISFKYVKYVLLQDRIILGFAEKAGNSIGKP